MNKDDLLDFLDKVGARSLEDYLTQDFEDPQEGLDERLDWARSRLPDPRYSRAARFLVAHESELRTILREGEQAWLLRQVSGSLPRQRRPAPVLPPPTPPPPKEEATPTMAPPQLLPGFSSATPVPPLDRTGTDSFGDGEIWEYGSRGAQRAVGGAGLAVAPGTYDGARGPANFDEPTMPTAWDTRTDETHAVRKALPPLDSVLDPSTEYDSQGGSTDLEELFGNSILHDPATEAVEGDWDRLAAVMPALSESPASRPASGGGLFEDILDDHDTHASFDTSTAPPSRSATPGAPARRPEPPKKGFDIPPEPWQEAPQPPAEPQPLADELARELYPSEPEPEPAFPPPEPMEIAPVLEPRAAAVEMAATEEVELAAPPEGQAPENPKPPKRRRYDPYLLAASILFGIGVAALAYAVRPFVLHGWHSWTSPVETVTEARVIVEPTVINTQADPAENAPEPVRDTGAPALEPSTTEGSEPPEGEPEPEALATAGEVEPSSAVPPAPVGPAPAPRPVGLSPAPRPVVPTPSPVPAAPGPRPVRPRPAAPSPEPAPAQPAPKPVASGPTGNWQGTNGTGSLTLRIDSTGAGKIRASATMDVSGTKRTVDLRGTYDSRSGRLSLTEVDGSLIMRGKLDDLKGEGSWAPGEGATERQWFVVRK